MSVATSSCSSSGFFCKGLYDAVFHVQPNSDQKGLSLSVGWVEGDGDGAKTRVLGVVYRRRNKEVGTYLNFCPWCGASLRFADSPSRPTDDDPSVKPGWDSENPASSPARLLEQPEALHGSGDGTAGRDTVHDEVAPHDLSIDPPLVIRKRNRSPVEGGAAATAGLTTASRPARSGAPSPPTAERTSVFMCRPNDGTRRR